VNPLKELLRKLKLETPEDLRAKPGPWMKRASSAVGKAFKYLSRPMSVKERDREHLAVQRCKELSAKFQKLDTRQQQRCRAFAEAFSRTRKEIGGEPRRARRKVARAWAKQAMRSTG
jgi:hypothetical protein